MAARAHLGELARRGVAQRGADRRRAARLATSLFQPLDVAHRLFVEPRVCVFDVSIEDVFRDDERVARYHFSDAIGAARRRPQHGPLRAGAHRVHLRRAQGRGRYRLRTLPEDETRRCRRSSSARSTTAAIPPSARRGACTAALEYMQLRRLRSVAIGTGSAPRSASGVAVPLRRDVLWVTAAGGSDLRGDLPADRAFAPRRAGQFPGLRARRTARRRLLDHRHELSVEREGSPADQQSRAVRRRGARRRRDLRPHR